MVDIFTPRRSATRTKPLADAASQPSGELRLLVVCTANISRSPLAAAILARRLTDRRFAVRVTSAGTRSTHLAVDELSVAAGSELGLDLAGHVPRKLTSDMIAEEGADLIVPMTREHLREIVLVDRKAWSRTFTLKELVRLADKHAAAAPDARTWIGALSSHRQPHDLLGDDDSDDIADTYGASMQAHRRTASEMSALADRLAGSLRRSLPPE